MVVELENEFIIDNSSSISSSIENFSASEKTPLVNYSPSESPVAVGLISLLVRSGPMPTVNLEKRFEIETLSCDDVIPNLVPYARSFQTWLNLNKVVAQVKYDSMVDAFKKIGSQVETVLKAGKLAIVSYLPFESMDVIDQALSALV